MLTQPDHRIRLFIYENEKGARAQRAQGRKGRNIFSFFKMTLKIFAQRRHDGKGRKGAKGAIFLAFFKMTLNFFFGNQSKKGAIGRKRAQ